MVRSRRGLGYGECRRSRRGLGYGECRIGRRGVGYGGLDRQERVGVWRFGYSGDGLRYGGWDW